MSVSGKERIEAVFRGLRGRDRRGLMPFIVGGRPRLEGEDGLGAVLRALSSAGASVIEVGIPFSDPIADGPVIASAMHEALEAGVTVQGVLAEAQRAAGEIEAPLVAMVSVSIVERFGATAFAGMLRDAGFCGAIFPDAPLEEAETLSGAASDAGLSASLLIAPTTPAERAASIARASTGFVYLVARAGITGEQCDDPSETIGQRVAQLREASDLPIACGFGVSTARHVELVTRHADAAIVGSALVKRLEKTTEAGGNAAEESERFVAELSGGLSSGRV